MARYYARDNFTADDLTSEAFERTMTVIRGGGGPDVSFRAYIYTAVRRLAYEQTEKGRRTHVTDDFTEFEMPDEVIDPAVTNFERTLVTGAFAGLPERWQAVLWYVEVEGMSPPEVAPLLGLTANGVSALAYRAREGLRQAYLQAHVVAEPARSACEEFRGKLGAYSRDGLASRDQAKVEKHLDTCDECPAILAELRDVGHGMRVIIAPLLLGGAAAAGLALGGSGSSATVAATIVRAPRSAWRTGRVIAAAAAVAAVALVATFLVLTASPSDQPMAASPTSAPASPAVEPRPPSTPKPTAVPTPAPTTPPARTVPTPGATVPPPAVVEPPQLILAMADVGDLVLGQDGMVGATLSNAGKGAASGLTLLVTLPAGVTPDVNRELTVDGAGWSCTTVGSTLRCTAASLGAGASVSIYLPVSVSTDADTAGAPGASSSAYGVPSQSVTAAMPVVARGLSTRFIANGTYATTVAGASFVSCDLAVPACLLARDRAPGAVLDNNDWAMVAVDAASTGSVSSTTQLAIPAGAEVTFAGLYWSGISPDATPDLALGAITLTSPGAVTSGVTAVRVDHDGTGSYQAFADVTAFVAAGGAGAWTASGALIGPGAPATPGAVLGAGVYAGWSLVVVYSDSTLSSGRATVFDGFERVAASEVSFVVAGLASSSVEVNAVIWEGDAGTVGDSLALDGIPLVRATGGADPGNAFDSTAVGSSWSNSFGVDAGAFQLAVLAQPRGILVASSSGDYFTVGVVTTTTR